MPIISVFPHSHVSSHVTVTHSSEPVDLFLGSLVQMNLYSMHRNQEHWKDPQVFRYTYIRPFIGNFCSKDLAMQDHTADVANGLL